jgi:hypothetical protein
MKRAVIAGLAALLMGGGAMSVSGCATTPEPCTSEWVHWKTERFVADFVRGHAKQFNDARNATAMFSGAGGINTSAGIPAMILTAAGVITLATDFMSDLWPEVSDALSQCDTAPRAAQLFASILREQGVDERAARAVEDMGLLLDRRS